MFNRYCIIAGARSGSTWLEEMIYNGFNTSYRIKLGEPLEHSADYFKSSGHNHTVVLHDTGFLRLSRLQNKIFEHKIEYLDYLIDTIKSGNPRQDIVLKVFPQDWKYSEEDYIKFLTVLQDLGFQFINLHRKVTDRAISWQIMEQSKIVHRWDDGHKLFFSKHGGIDNNVKDLASKSIILDPKVFIDYMNLTNAEDNLISRVSTQFNGINVNYETLVEDCIANSIPITTLTKVQKLYATPYKDSILNYNEIVSITNQPDFISKYGINSQLPNPMLDTICEYAWDYTILMLSRKEMRNCCRTMTNKLTSADLANGKDLVKNFTPIIQLKKDLLSGVQNNACKTCWQIEKTGAKSPRSGINNFSKFVQRNLWKNDSIPTIKSRLLNISDQDREDVLNIDTTRMVELSLGNTCDLKCMYCHSHYSSQWAAEQLKYGEIKVIEIEKELSKYEDNEFENTWWDWFENKAAYTVDCINFIGGEPLIISKFYKYIDRIINFYNTHSTIQPEITISVVSNFNTPSKQFEMFLNCVEKLVTHGKFKIDMNVSMEQIGERAEFVRTGTNWQLLTTNINYFLEFMKRVDVYKPKRIIFNLQIALNALCISALPEFIKYVIDLQKNNSNILINLRQNQISFPQWMSPYILPTTYSVYIDETIQLLENEKVDNSKYTEFGKWNSYIVFLKAVKNGILNPAKHSQPRIEFVKNIDKLTSRRNLDFPKTFPEMTDFYNECKLLSITK
jgi:hypothetical protein